MDSKAKKGLNNHILRGKNPQAAQMVSELRYDNHVIYFRGDISALSGLQKQIQVSLGEQVGLVNVDKGKLSEGELFAFDRIAIRSVQTADTVTSAAKVNGYSGDVQSFDPALRNGEFVVKQNEGEKLRIPVAMCGGNAESDMAAGMADAYKLEDPIVLDDKRQFETLIEFADGETVTPAANSKIWVEVLLIGIKTKVRANS